MKRKIAFLAGIAGVALAGCSVGVTGNSSVSITNDTITNDIGTADNATIETITNDDAMGNGDAMAVDSGNMADAGEGEGQ